MNESHDTRLMLLGQIAVVRARLDRLEGLLAEQPLMAASPYRSEQIADAIGNVSVQTGVLIATIAQYQDAQRGDTS